MPQNRGPSRAFLSLGAEGCASRFHVLKKAARRPFSPVDGVAGVVFPTGHALGLMSDTGVELLVHIGMDTVNLEGKGFTTHVKQGD